MRLLPRSRERPLRCAWARLPRADLDAAREQIEASLARIEGNADVGSAVGGADLDNLQAIPEDLAIKQSFYSALSGVAPVGAIFAEATRRP